MNSRIFVTISVVSLILGFTILSVIAQDETSTQTQPDEVIVEKMTINATSPSDHIFSIIQFAYLDYIQKNKKDKTFEITINSKTEDKAIESFINQEISNIAISRLLTKSEIDKFISKNNKTPKVTSAFKTPLVVVVHKTNTIKKFDYATLKKIFTGEITSWKELDEDAVDDQIELLLPPVDSEAYRLFKAEVLDGEDFATEKVTIAEEKTLSDNLKLAGGRITFMSNCYVGTNPRVQRADLLNESGKTYNMREVDVKNDAYPLVLRTYIYYTEELPGAYSQFFNFAKENPTGLNSYRIYRIVSID